MLDSIWHRDGFGFYDNVKETVVTGGAATQLCAADPDRVRLIIGVASTHILISTNPNPVAGQGLPVNANFGPQTFAWEIDGPLVCSAWFADLSGITGCTVIEVFLRRDPRDRGYPAAYLNPSPIPERGAPAPTRQRRALPRSVAHRSGLYARFARSNPDLWE